MRPILLTLGLALGGLSAPLPAQDWPQFLGPDRNAHAGWPGEQPLIVEGETEVLWRTPLGRGYGGPAVRDGEVFLLDRKEKEADRLRVFELATGKPLWEASYPAKGRLNFKGSRSVPAVTDSHVFAAGGMGHVTAFDREKQAIAWSHNVEEELGGLRPMFGYSTSVLLVGDLVVAAVLGKDVGLVAYDQASGEVRWKSEHAGYSHSTPALLQIGGEEQIVFLACPEPASGRDRAEPSWIQGFEPATGKLLWRYETTFARLPIPPPVQVDAERIFVTAGYRAGSKLLRITKVDENYAVEELFETGRGAQIHAPVLHGEYLYYLANENANDSRRRRSEGGLVCLGLDGKERWRTGEDPYFGRGALLLVGDQLLVQDGFSGDLQAVAASPEAYTPGARFSPFDSEEGDDGQIWAPMAMSGSLVLTRDHYELVCVSLTSR